jgi:ABC-type transport system involved in cytochrome bd biosynthesis fused ATPase/permease subunit
MTGQGDLPHHALPARPVLDGRPVGRVSADALPAAAFVLAVVLARRIARSPVGLILRGMKENSGRVAMPGHDVPIENNEVVELFGRNGAGKTTTLPRTPMGVLWAFHGTIR